MGKILSAATGAGFAAISCLSTISGLKPQAVVFGAGACSLFECESAVVVFFSAKVFMHRCIPVADEMAREAITR